MSQFVDVTQSDLVCDAAKSTCRVPCNLEGDDNSSQRYDGFESGEIAVFTMCQIKFVARRTSEKISCKDGAVQNSPSKLLCMYDCACTGQAACQ